MNLNVLREVPRCDRIHKSAGFPTAVIFLNLVVAAVTWDKGARADACSENAGDTSTNLPPKNKSRRVDALLESVTHSRIRSGQTCKHRVCVRKSIPRRPGSSERSPQFVLKKRIAADSMDEVDYLQQYAADSLPFEEKPEIKPLGLHQLQDADINRADGENNLRFYLEKTAN